ncbi:MAG: hypothetical protein A3B44_02455 [Candidatus Levybacteria bacterium RIFCSPLOWO2_01_FULL_38_21]|nr:MAG: hypothetical protein A3B44_02455 [Candidatus Levybacteria bacterium RIFCSPLOWO2_01_FULL_38_21]
MEEPPFSFKTKTVQGSAIHPSPQEVRGKGNIQRRGGETIMNNTKRKIAGAIATGALLLNAFAPLAFADTTIQISGNGVGSNNYANVTQTSNTSVTQNNTASVNNNVNANADTGDNKANFNTGGNTTINTGNANVTANVSNTLNSNAAEVECCATGNTDVLIEGNGVGSNNTVNLTQNSTTTVKQNNNANVNNNVNANADTGDNSAKWNTGGDVTINTGNATVNASVSTIANSNWAKISPAAGSGSSTDVTLKILGNGAGSNNFIGAKLAKTTSVNQSNSANVNNNVNANADTGDNKAKFNTGGDVIIDTGNAKVNVDVDNMVNFNWADVDCGCAYGLLAKIDGNGVGGPGDDPKGDPNTITATLVSMQTVGQGNGASLYNNANGNADTGYNKAKWNTGGVDGGDPSVVTGNAEDNVDVSNSGNVNALGSVPPLTWPDMPPIGMEINWAAFLAFFGMFVH